MASISSLPRLPHLHSRSRRLSPPLPPPAASHRRLLRRPAIACGGGDSRPGSEEGLVAKRREALIQILLSAAILPSFPESSLAESDLQQESRDYEDEENKFKISVPRDWLVGKGETDGIKSVTAFYPEGTSDSNVSIAITGIGPDFTKLGSFGDVDTFAERLVTGMDRSWRRPPGLAAKLINSSSANGLYYVEYTLQNPGERRRHLFSAVGLASNGWVNRLYTVTGQFMEDESDKFGLQIQNCVSSFRLTK